MKTTNIRISQDTADKLKEIRDVNGIKSIDETLKRLIPEATNEKMEFIHESPAFTLINNNDETFTISWDELKKAEIGKTWSNGETATILFTDDDGVLIRFEDIYGEIFLNYFHFFK